MEINSPSMGIPDGVAKQLEKELEELEKDKQNQDLADKSPKGSKVRFFSKRFCVVVRVGGHIGHVGALSDNKLTNRHCMGYTNALQRFVMCLMWFDILIVLFFS